MRFSWNLKEICHTSQGMYGKKETQRVQDPWQTQAWVILLIRYLGLCDDEKFLKIRLICSTHNTDPDWFIAIHSWDPGYKAALLKQQHVLSILPCLIFILSFTTCIFSLAKQSRELTHLCVMMWPDITSSVCVCAQKCTRDALYVWSWKFQWEFLQPLVWKLKCLYFLQMPPAGFTEGKRNVSADPLLF